MVRALALGILLMGCATPTADAAGGGLYGKVTRGPVTPVCVAGRPCDAPAPGVTLAFARNGTIVARIRTGPGGLYRIALAPGTYTVREVRPGTAIAPPATKPLVVSVLSHLWTRQDLAVDTGIR